jgi:hypothetical protein
VVLLFWCRHSSASVEVAKEYGQALEQGKKIIPVLLDATPLPENLAELQAIFMQLGFDDHEEDDRGEEPGAFRLAQVYYPLDQDSIPQLMACYIKVRVERIISGMSQELPSSQS